MDYCKETGRTQLICDSFDKENACINRIQHRSLCLFTKMFNDTNLRIIDFVHPNYFKVIKLLRPCQVQPKPISPQNIPRKAKKVRESQFLVYKEYISRVKNKAAESSEDSDDETYHAVRRPSRQRITRTRPKLDIASIIKGEREDSDYEYTPNRLTGMTRMTIVDTSDEEEEEGDDPEMNFETTSDEDDVKDNSNKQDDREEHTKLYTNMRPVRLKCMKESSDSEQGSNSGFESTRQNSPIHSPGCDACPHGSDSDCNEYQSKSKKICLLSQRMRTPVTTYNDAYTTINGIPVHISDSEKSNQSTPVKQSVIPRAPSPELIKSLPIKSFMKIPVHISDSEISTPVKKPVVLPEQVKTPSPDLIQTFPTKPYMEETSNKSKRDLLRSPIDIDTESEGDEPNVQHDNVDLSLKWTKQSILCPIIGCGKHITSDIDRWDSRCEDMAKGHFKTIHNLEVQKLIHTCTQCNGK